MKGRWAAGIVPRNFAWILKDQLALSERPGGYAPHHRRVRRQEEILWLRAQGFTRVVSLLPSNHNLHAYDELDLPSSHFPLPAQGDVRPALAACYPALLDWVRGGERLLMHHEELGERLAGVAAGFLCWSGVLPEPPQAVSVVEQLLKRQMGSAGRAIVASAATLAPARRTAFPPGTASGPQVASVVEDAEQAFVAEKASVEAPLPPTDAAPAEPGDIPAKARRVAKAKSAPVVPEVAPAPVVVKGGGTASDAGAKSVAASDSPTGGEGAAERS
ncbi:MAG: hypothetical protein JWM85_1199 [Acidimicrobiaceae bacterium]|nr:hypothetical protein [Acidimicrobiaceae bacterium]